MIAAIYKCDEAFNLLLKYGGIDMHTTDCSGLTLLSLASKYNATTIKQTIISELYHTNHAGIIELNYKNLEAIPDLELLMHLNENSDVNKDEFEFDDS